MLQNLIHTLPLGMLPSNTHKARSLSSSVMNVR
jgi:hypothetical protein